MTELDKVKEQLEVYRQALNLAAWELDLICPDDEKEAWGCYSPQDWVVELWSNAKTLQEMKKERSKKCHS